VNAKKAHVLVIDDWGWEPKDDVIIPEILAERYDTKRVTIITSALTPEELTARYGAAVVRRALGDPKTGKIISLFASTKPVAVGGSK
jgi:DNA replication protein DnaC